MNKNSSGLRVVKHFDTALQLIVRTIVGTIFGLAGAFLGSLVNAAVIPPTASDDLLLSIARISVIGAMAALIAQIGWIKIVDSWIQSMLISSPFKSAFKSLLKGRAPEALPVGD